MRSILSTSRRVAAGVFILSTVILVAGCDSGELSDSVSSANVTFKIATYSYSGMQSDVSVDEATILVREIDINNAAADGNLEKSVAEENEEARRPVVVALDPDVPEESAVTYRLPSGMYDNVRFEVYQPGVDDELGRPELVDGPEADQRYSIIVRGTVEEEPFELKLATAFEQVLESPRPMVIERSDSPTEIDIIVDAGSWFVDEEGAQLDPRDGRHMESIKQAIRRSFRHSRRRNPRFRELVGICHFQGHEGPETRDFVLLNTRNPVVCTDEGGTPTEVTRFDCRYRHRAIERFEEYNCKTENLE